MNTAPVLVCPCADVGARLSVLVAVVGHGRGRAWCAGGGVQPGAGLADAGLPLGGELVAFLGGACLARQVLRVEPGSMCGAALLVAGGVLGGVMASGVRLGAVLWCVGSRPAFAGLSALPSSMLLARLSVAVAVGFCRAVRPVLTVNGVVIVRVRIGAAGGLTWRAWSSVDLARLVIGRRVVPRRRVGRVGRRVLSPQHIGTVKHGDRLAADA